MKKRTKRLLTVIVSLVLIIGAMSVSALAADKVASGTCGENLTWVLDDEGTLTISGTGSMRDFDDDLPPWFLMNSQIERIVIEPGCTKIGEYAFELTDAISITIPASVNEISRSVFFGCYDLNEIYIDDLSAWCNITFENDSSNPLSCSFDSKLYLDGELVTNLVIPSGISYIDDYVFYGCESLKSVVIPDGVISINESAFEECYNLTNVSVAKSVTSIGNRAFAWCGSLTNITIPDSVTSIDDEAFAASGLISIVIPDGITQISSSVFANCENLLDVTIPDSVISVENHAFDGCKSLTNINIPKGVTDIGRYAFYGCKKLTEISIPDGIICIEDSTFADCTNLISINIPNSVNEIGEAAFSGCTSLTEINIPDDITYIEDSTFSGCAGLTDIHIPDGVTYIGYCAFDSCKGLTNINIPDGVTYIGEYAFYGCEGLTNIHIPDGVTYIGECAFYSCESLTNINISDSVISIGDYAFDMCTSLNGIWVDEDNQNYSSDARGILFNKEKTELIAAPGSLSGSYTIPNSVTSICDHAFRGCNDLVSVNIPASVISIGDRTFSDCNSLIGIWVDEANLNFSSDERGVLFNKNKSSLIKMPSKLSGDYSIPNSVTSFDSWAFENSNLNSISIPASVKDIDLYDCTNLTAIWVDENNLYYSNDENGVLFNKDKSELIRVPSEITGSYSIPDGVISVNSDAFYSCDKLTDIIVPASVTSLGNRYEWGELVPILQKCNSLTGIWVDEENKSYSSDENGVLFNKDKSELIKIPNGMKGNYSIPEGVSDVTYYAFSNSSLSGITIPASVHELEEQAFSGMTSLRTIIFRGDWVESYYYDGKGDPIIDLSGITATAYYPENNPTWTRDNRDSYGGNITWVAYDPNDPPKLPAAYPQGDVNGDNNISNADLIILARYIVGADESAGVSQYGDMNSDGQITNADLVMIARIIVGLE